MTATARQRHPHASQDRISTTIGRRDRIRGDLHIAGGVCIDGVMHGNVEPGGDDAVVIVSHGAYVEGCIRAHSVRIAGHVVGLLRVEGHVHLTDTARIEGDIHYGSMVVEAGAGVTGRLVCMHPDETGDSR